MKILLEENNVATIKVFNPENELQDRPNQSRMRERFFPDREKNAISYLIAPKKKIGQRNTEFFAIRM